MCLMESQHGGKDTETGVLKDNFIPVADRAESQASTEEQRDAGQRSVISSVAKQ